MLRPQFISRSRTICFYVICILCVNKILVPFISTVYNNVAQQIHKKAEPTRNSNERRMTG